MRGSVPDYCANFLARMSPTTAGFAFPCDSFITWPLIALIACSLPAELAGENPKTKITLEVDVEALEFFKREARKHNSSYQRMMRNLLGHYARTRHAVTK